MAMKGESISMKTEEAVKQLSIIIPMYNAEKTIQKCLRSLILPKEQMERLEVIVVDDGSQDRSARSEERRGGKECEPRGIYRGGAGG